MIPVSVYIDGFNVYHALLKFKDERVKWLDLRALSQRIIRPKTEQIKGINYFSAFANWLPDSKRRHQEYIKALTAYDVHCVMGHFKVKSRGCNSCGAKWKGHEEVVSRFFRTFGLAERRPALAYAVMAPLIC